MRAVNLADRHHTVVEMHRGGIDLYCAWLSLAKIVNAWSRASYRSDGSKPGRARRSGLVAISYPSSPATFLLRFFSW